MTDSPDTPAPLIPAATVILLRDGPDGLETLMLQKNRALKAFGGMWVFPGGKIDACDGTPGCSPEARARAAAVRECIEETGLHIPPEALVPLSVWIPPVQEKRRFETSFFLAPAPDSPVKIDEGEIHAYQWMSVRDVVHRTPDPELRLVPPTFVSLSGLLAFDRVSDALTDIAARNDERFETVFIHHEGGFTTLWEKDAGYAQADLHASGPRHRLTCAADGWVYERPDGFL